MIDLDYQARTDAFDFFGGGQFLKSIHTNSICMVSRMPFMLLHDFASAFLSMAHAWLSPVLEATEIWESSPTGIENLYMGDKHMLSLMALCNMLPILSGVTRLPTEWHSFDMGY